MIKRILVATDLSLRSEKVLRRAKLIASNTGAVLTLTHIVDHDQPNRLLAPALVEARASLREIAAGYKKEANVRAEPFVKAAEPSEGILSVADEIDADLIIVGPHQNQALGTFPGRTVGRVVRSSDRPLLITAMSPSEAYHRSLLALAFDESSIAAARASLAFGLFDRMHVTVMHSLDDTSNGQQEQVTRRLRAQIDSLGLDPQVRTIVRLGPPARTILECACDEHADLVILGTSQRSGVSRLLIGSVAGDVISSSERDLLIVPAP